MKKLACLFLLFCITYRYANAQAVDYKQYTVKDGLSSNNVFRAFEDKEGYMWISCDYGLSRFDGYKFKNYGFEKMNGSILSIDERGNELWAGVYSTYQYLISKIDITEFKPAKGDITPTVIKMQIDDKNRRWMLNNSNRIQYVINDTVYSYLPITKENDSLEVYDILYKEHIGLLIGTNKGVYRVNEDKTVSLYNLNLPAKPVYTIAIDIHNVIYLGHQGSISIYNNNSLKTVSLSGNKKVKRLVAHDSTKVWFLSPLPGIYMLEGEKEVSLSADLGLNNIYINDIFCSRSGILFICSNGKGLYILNHTGTIYYNEQSGLSNNNVFAVYSIKDNIFVGGRGKVNLYKNGQLSSLNIPQRPDEKINSIIAVGDDLWVASPFNIYKYNIKTKKSVQFYPGAIHLALGEGGNIIASGYTGVYSINPGINKACSLSSAFPLIETKRVTASYYDRGRGYWFGAGNGVTLYNNGDTIVYGDTFTSGARRVVNDIQKDANGTLWMATRRGLVSYDKNHVWHAYFVKDGLPDNICLSLFIKGTTIFIGTTRGLASFDGKTFIKYGPEKGFPLNEINAIYERGDDILLGTSEGLYICKDYLHKPDLPLPSIKFTSFRYADSLIPVRDTISIPYGNKALMVDFTALEFWRQDYLAYEYRLKNLGDHWYELQGRSIPLTSLSPGTYTLELRIKHKTSLKVSESSNVTIIVLPPYWQSWWFILLCFLLTSTTIILLLSWRIKRVKQKEKARLQRYTRLLQLKQQATNALISPHFIFNALNSIQHFINRADSLSANRFLSKFAKLIRTTMERSAKLNIKLSEEIEALELYLSLEAIRLNGKLTYSISIDEKLDKERIMIPGILIQPYVENAVWHGITPKNAEGNISVEIKKDKEPFVRINIEDNGIGIDQPKTGKGKNHNSIGLKLSEERLRMIEKLTGQKVSIEIKPLFNDDGSKRGTLVSILLPVNSN